MNNTFIKDEVNELNEVNESKIMSDTLRTSFSTLEIDDMLNGKIIEINHIYYCIHKHTLMYCRDLDHDIWVAFNGIGGIV